MSKHLALSAAFSVLLMSGFALLHEDSARLPGAMAANAELAEMVELPSAGPMVRALID